VQVYDAGGTLLTLDSGTKIQVELLVNGSKRPTPQLVGTTLYNVQFGQARRTPPHPSACVRPRAAHGREQEIGLRRGGHQIFTADFSADTEAVEFAGR
jgi:hypothetical protein